MWSGSSESPACCFSPGSLFSIPSGIVIEPAPPLSDYWISFTGR
jgi:hypothetical protein